MHTPVARAGADTLNELVALAVLSIVSLVRDFRRQAAMAPMMPGTSGKRNFTLLLYQFAEQRTERFLQGCWLTTLRSSSTKRLTEDKRIRPGRIGPTPGETSLSSDTVVRVVCLCLGRVFNSRNSLPSYRNCLFLRDDSPYIYVCCVSTIYLVDFCCLIQGIINRFNFVVLENGC